MSQEIRVCQNCKKEFVIESEDFQFYKKINVPPPTWCPECQMQRLMTWRNERSLYKRKDESGKDIISIYSSDKPFTVYDRERWWSDDWDPLAYGKEYDFSKPFFVQFRELLERVPLESLFNKNAVSSPYCNHCEDMKNCYLSFASIWNENVSYSRGAIKCKDSLDVFFCDKSELMYETTSCEECYRVFFSTYSSFCSDSTFLVDCRGCSNCFGCINLRNKSYYIFNQPYTNDKIPDHIKDVPDSILNEIIECQHQQKCNEQCTTAFKIVPQELQFYRRLNLPLPRFCPNCRHYWRLKQRNPLKLWHRACQCAGSTSSPQAGTMSENKIYRNTAEHFHKDAHCPNEFETSYAPERTEIIYCENCYNAEVV